ncbi:MAG: MASE1 domain-containing protein [Hyphomicrobiaceae bacterium]|nr:MASE1 domain-containing protein [Hyphomicrobiaceae bacterium]
MSKLDVTTWHATIGRHVPAGAALALFYLAFIAAAGFGQWLTAIPGITITMWPPNGLVIATLMLNPGPAWPWWLATAALAELTGNMLWFDNPLPPALAYTAANAIECVTAAWLLRPYFPSPARLRALPQVIAFVALGVGIAPLIGATIGSSIDALVGKHAFAVAWPLWWIGDATGILVAAPLTLVLVEVWRERPHVTIPDLLEAGALGVTLLGIGSLALGGHFPFAFILMPPMLWAAVRFEFPGAAITTALVALLVALFTVTGVSEFKPDGTGTRNHVVMQLFLAVCALTGLVVAAISRQHRHALLSLVSAKASLEARVAERTRAVTESEARFRTMADSAPVMVRVIEKDGTCSYLSRSWYEFTGQPFATGLGFGWLAAVHPEDRWRAEHEFTAAARERRAVRLEYRLRRHDGSYRWAIDAAAPRLSDSGVFLGYIGSVMDITDRKQQEDQVRLLMREVNHRSKNMLTLVLALARQTASYGTENYVERFQRRIQALAASQDLLVKSEWTTVSLLELVHSQLSHLGRDLESRFAITGPTLHISAAAAQTLGMAVHELATNAVKHGSLSNATGHVAIDWELGAGNSADAQFTMSWIEIGGPPVSERQRRGFGSVVIVGMVERGLGGHVMLDYRPTGVAWHLSCPAASILHRLDEHAAAVGPHAELGRLTAITQPSTL